VDTCRGGDQAIQHRDRVGHAETAPAFSDLAIDRKDALLLEADVSLEPPLKGGGSPEVAAADAFYSPEDLADGQDAQENVFVRNRREPTPDILVAA
jgi:hypothetical protein